MKKFMSKAMILTMVAVMAIGATACSVSTYHTSETVTTQAQDGMVNPIHESSQEEIQQEFGITLQAPDGASDIRYSIIDSEDGKIAQMDFTVDGKEMCLRAKHTTITNVNEAANIENGPESANISGLFYDWSYIGVDTVQDNPAVLRISDEKAGYIGWLDIVPGVLYNLSMTENATPEDLAKYANMAFVPYDGEETANQTENQLTSCFESIYECKAGTAGSSERVTAAAKQMVDFISRNDEEVYSLEAACDMTEYAFDSLKETYPEENMNDNFKESFDAVVEEIKNTEPNVSEMESFKCIVRAVEIHMEDAAK